MCALDGGRDEGGVSSANAISGERFRDTRVDMTGVKEGEGGCGFCGCGMTAAVLWSERKRDSGQGTSGRPVPR